jgi:hypothetical protein
VAVLTRVEVSYRMAPKFYGWALPPVAFQVDRTPGMVLSVGMTERLVRSGATFSIWRSLRDMQAFGYHHPPHGAVQRRARARRWFEEELFVRFRVVRADGSWRGRRFAGPPSVVFRHPGCPDSRPLALFRRTRSECTML